MIGSQTNHYPFRRLGCRKFQGILLIIHRMIRRAISAAGVLLAVNAAWGAANPATAPTTLPGGETPLTSLASEKLRERGQFDALWESRDFPKLPDGPISQFLTIRNENGWLIVDSPFDSGKTQTLQFHTSPDADGSLRLSHDLQIPTSKTLIMELHDYGLPDRVDRYLQVTSVPYLLHIEVHNEFLDRDEGVSLTQKRDADSPEAVILRVNLIGDTGQMESTGKMFSAATWWELRRDHPREVEKYLRPMFRDFDLEAGAFAVNDKTAWQVVGDAWTPPPGLAQKVQTIVAQLNADDYDARAAAQTDLEKLGQPAALYLLANPIPNLSEEQSARVKKFLDSYHPLTEGQAIQFRQDANFLLDCLYSDDADLREAALKDLARLDRQIDVDSLKMDQPPGKRMENIQRIRDALSSTTARTQP
jgi:hypothetical protein